jgi:hypothetical protein
MRKLFVPAALFAATALAVAQAPLPVLVEDGPVVITKDGPVPPGAVAKGGPTAAKAPGPKDSPRLAKLKQLQFDRKPSSVLKAWAPERKDDTRAGPVKDPKEAALEKELDAFRKAVLVGEWTQVRDYLASLPDEAALAAYKQMLQSLQQTSAPRVPTEGPDAEMYQRMLQMMPGAQQFAERNTFTLDDVLGLAAAAPTRTNPTIFPQRSAVAGAAVIASQAPKGIIDKEHLPAYANFLRDVLQTGTLIEVVVAKLKTEAGKPAPILTRRQVAKLLTLAGQPAYTGDFLPTPEEAVKAKDIEGLNLLSRHYQALHAKEAKSGNLEKAWHAVQMALAFQAGTREDQEEALLRAVELAPRVTDKLGQAWLDESFTKKPDRGMEILATVGTLVSQGLATRPFATEDRLNALKLTKTAVEALLKAAPQKAAEWKGTLTLLAAGWLKEAEFSRQNDYSSGSGPRLRQDMFGNIFYTSDDDDDGRMRMMMMNRGNQPQPVPVGEVLRARPNEQWIQAIDEGLRPKLAGLLAQLHLKVGEEDKAFPLIATLADAQPDEAKALVREFLRVWTRNHNPNEQRNRYRYSWFFYGYETRAESIPLTRSKQERNLQELAEWVKKIRALPKIGEMDDELMVRAFTACHSSAEVYKTEAIETVFGPLGTLKPRTLAGLAQQMRTNLAGLWRSPAEQQNKKTNRKKKDIEAEVLRGYQVAHQAVEDGLKKFPDHWSLLAAKASLLHDEINYRQELNKSSEFSARRGQALALYKKAAERYAAEAPKLPTDEQTNLVYDLWFAATLGAVDLGMITEEKQPDWKQPALIRDALKAIPGEVGTKHFDRFANELFTRLSGAKPHIKFNYLKAGFEIVGDHKQAVEAKKVFDYYKDLVREIKLDTVVDGPAKVGHGKPFGFFVNIRHTRDIERESGGFSRYLQNQNASGYFSYNYGRPTADYRDRFETTVKEALKEHFEVVSVTFQVDTVNSRAAEEYGWRYTPYAYVLVKPRGPQVDAIPPLRIDLDFLDTSGYVVLPVESPKVPIDASPSKGEPRPIENLTVTQTLDERQADKGILILEVKAVGVGLIPDLEDLCGSLAPDGFEVIKVEDQGLGVKKFDEDAQKNAILSERVWQVTLKGLSGQSELPKTFRFASVKLPTKETIYQRYNDADLAVVEQDVSLERVYGTQNRLWVWLAAVGGVVFLAFLGVLAWLLMRPKAAVTAGPVLPEDLNAFNVIGLLQRLQAEKKLTPDQKGELDRAIAGLEEYYFSDRNGHTAPDLRVIAERWVTVVR